MVPNFHAARDGLDIEAKLKKNKATSTSRCNFEMSVLEYHRGNFLILAKPLFADHLTIFSTLID